MTPFLVASPATPIPPTLPQSFTPLFGLPPLSSSSSYLCTLPSTTTSTATSTQHLGSTSTSTTSKQPAPPAPATTINLMASLHHRLQIRVRQPPPPSTATPQPSRLPSLAEALAHSPPTPARPERLPPLAAIFDLPSPAAARLPDGLPAPPPPLVDAKRPRAVPSVILLKEEGNCSPQQRSPSPIGDVGRGLDCIIDLTTAPHDSKAPPFHAVPFPSGQRDHRGWRSAFTGNDGIAGSSAGGDDVSTTRDGGQPIVRESVSPREMARASSHDDCPGDEAEVADGDGEKRCAHCGTRSTPEWRRGPTGRGTLCNACGLKYTKTLQQARRRKGQSGSTLGAVPLASLLNGPEDRKRRTSLTSPMVWQTKVKNFVSSVPVASFSCSSLPQFSHSPSFSSSPSPPSRKRARTNSLPNPTTHRD